MLARIGTESPAPAVVAMSVRTGSTATLIGQALERAGLHVARPVAPGALPRLLATTEPEAAVLMLETGEDPAAAVARVRTATRRTRLLVLDPAGGTERAVDALRAGADSYLEAPLHVPEVVARIRALIRRIGDGAPAGTAAPVKVGSLTLDLETRTLHGGAAPLELTPREAAVLAVLAREPGRALSSEALKQEVWGESGGDAANLRMQVSAVRVKLAAAGAAPVLETVWGFGYRLAAAR